MKRIILVTVSLAFIATMAFAKFISEALFSSEQFTSGSHSSVIDVNAVKNYDLTLTVTNEAPGNAACASDDVCVDLDTDTITFDAAHGYATGIAGEFTSTGTLPTPLAPSTPYYLGVESDDTVKVYETAEDAEAGTDGIDLTAITQGSGGGYPGFTFDDSALSASAKLQRNDAPGNADAQWVDVTDSSQDVSAGGTFNWTGTTAARQLRLIYDGTAGQATVTARFSGKD